MIKARFQSGSAIVEVVDHPEDSGVLLTISKERWDEDNVQIRLPRHIARAIGLTMAGEGE
jgi:hypothetical protein